MKKIISAISCAALLCSSVPMLASAETETSSGTKNSGYVDFLSMSDEEFVDYVLNLDTPYRFARYFDVGFGDETLTAEEKFQLLFPDIIWHDSDGNIISHLKNENFAQWEMIVNGQKSSTMAFFVLNDSLLDEEATAATFGFPENWKLELYDGQDPRTDWTRSVRIYYITPPVEVFEDYENWVRMEIAANCLTDTSFSYVDPSYGIDLYTAPTFGGCYGGDITSDVLGDVNLDRKLDMADAVLIMQSISNPDKYGVYGNAEVRMTKNGLALGDIDGQGDGVTAHDALVIQRMLLGLDN